MVYGKFGKRVFDLGVGVILIGFFSPLFLVAGLLVRTRLGSPIFFRQDRPGLQGKPFRIIKFRTMTDERDDKGELLPDAVRLTAFGRFLRSSSLDELPELINV